VARILAGLLAGLRWLRAIAPKVRTWLRWFLFRFHWRLAIASLAYATAPWIAQPEHVGKLRDACLLVIVVSLGVWADHIGKRNGEHPHRNGLFGVREHERSGGKVYEHHEYAPPGSYRK